MFKQISAQIVVVTLSLIAVFCPQFAQAQDRSGTLQGVVKDSLEAPVSGAFVKLKNAERRLTFMVVSQAQGRYSVNSLPAGKYVVQAIGGDYQSDLSAPVDVAPGRPATVDLSLTAMRAPQLPGAWPGRAPGERGGEAEEATRGAPTLPEGEGKQIVESKCVVGCHDAQRVVRARADRDRWEAIILNMRLYARGSTLAKDLTDQEAKVLLDYVTTNFGAELGPQDRNPIPIAACPELWSKVRQPNTLPWNMRCRIPTLNRTRLPWTPRETAGSPNAAAASWAAWIPRRWSTPKLAPPAATSKTNRLNAHHSRSEQYAVVHRRRSQPPMVELRHEDQRVQRL